MMASKALTLSISSESVLFLARHPISVVPTTLFSLELHTPLHITPYELLHGSSTHDPIGTACNTLHYIVFIPIDAQSLRRCCSASSPL